MENRGQKRTELDDELPADKRACNSLEFRASSSNSSAQTHMNSVNSAPETNDHDMDTSSSASANSRSEGEHERDSAYGSCDSDDADERHSELKDYQRRRSSGDHGKFKRILSSLSEDTDPSGQLAVLTELCEVLSFCTEDSLSGMTSDALSPLLVRLAKHETNLDIMLLAIRAITYLCDVYPKSSGFLVRHDAVPALCQRLMAIEYLDVAEQCLQALEKMSREQPLACLQSGAIMAVLNYIDFFSTSIQRVALSTVVNICKKLPSECPSPFMEAVPILCNLLQYEDPQLVENVAVCLIKITERVSQSTEMLDELCKHGIIRQVTHFMSLNTRPTLSQPLSNGLMGVLAKLSSGSVVAFRTLYELNISSILKDILSTYDLSHGMSSNHVVDGHCNQVYEVLKLLNELLPTSTRDQENPPLSDKESLLVNQPDLLQKFGMDILPLLTQFVNSGANLYICYGCLSVIDKLIYLSTSDMLVELLQKANISSFLAGVFTRKDPHVLTLALHIAELILQKLSDYFLDSFIKEGVFFAIDALLTPDKCQLVTLEKCSRLLFPVFSGSQILLDPRQKATSREVLRCLCYAFASDRSPSVSEKGSCMLEKDSVYNLAKHIRTKYFAQELYDPEKALTDVLQKLRKFSSAISDLNTSMNNDALDQHGEGFYSIMRQVMEKLGGGEPISTFEFIESGILRSLLTYLSNGQYLKQKGELSAGNSDIYSVEKRFEVFARLLFSPLDMITADLPMVTLIRKLQNALSSLENFPVILSNVPKLRSSYATLPYGRRTTYPCFKVRFVKDKGETRLCDYREGVLTVDPFSSLHAIEEVLWPKVKAKRTSHIKSPTQVKDQSESLPDQSPSNASSSQGGSPHPMEPESMSTDLPELQEPVEKEAQCASEEDTEMEEQYPVSCSKEDSSSKLLFYLEGQQLEPSLTLYQAILQQQMNEHEIVIGSKLWTQEYTLTYRKAEGQYGTRKECCSAESSAEKVDVHELYTSIFSSMFAYDLASDLEKSSPVYDIIYILKSLERMNKVIFHLMSRERICAFAKGKIDDLDNFQTAVIPVPQNEFVSSKLTEKLEQQMRDALAVSIGGMPLWCNQLMESCPFLFSFEVKCKYFRLAAFGPLLGQPHSPSYRDSGVTSDRRLSSGSMPRKKFLVFRNQILDSAAQMMDQHARQKVLLEVEYNEEVGTGLGPTLEFYTLVSHEFQKSGLGMWREDRGSFTTGTSHAGDSGILICPFGLFPCPWLGTSDEMQIQFSEVIKKFVLLGQIVGKALQDGRVLDVHFSKAFYKLILGKELGVYDILSFDPELGKTLLEFKALVDRKRFSESIHGESTTLKFDSCFRKTQIEDLCLDFTLPGYPDFILSSRPDHKMVNITNLEDYVSLVADATVTAGISRQVEAFKSGFNQEPVEKEAQCASEEDTEMEEQYPVSCSKEDSSSKLLFYLEGQQLEPSLTLYQAILQQQMNEHEIVIGSKLWTQEYTLTYRKAEGQYGTRKECCSAESSAEKVDVHELYTSIFSSMFAYDLASDLEKSSPVYDIIYILKSLERMNKVIFHLMSRERICAFAKGKIDDLDNFQTAVIPVPQNEFVSSKLTEKLEQQMRDALAVSIGGMPLWCNQLMESCPFLFSFEVKCKYFRLAAFGPLLGQPHSPSYRDSGVTSDRRLSSGSMPRKKFLVFRNQILDSAAQMMDQHARQKVLLEVEYNEEVGTGLGPTLEFYTLVSHEFQKSGLGMWREDRGSFTTGTSHAGDSGILICPFGLFPCPWLGTSDEMQIQFSEVIKKFVLLGQIVGKALQDGRVLDVHFSKAFYKLILGKELGVYDILSFDPELGKTLLEFKALVDRKRFSESIHGESTTLKFDSCFRKTQIEDLCLDFTLPGYPDFILSSRPDHKMVNITNLEDYVSLVADATVTAGISRQVEAFKSGFNQVFPIEHLQIFTEEELERLLCGERDSWAFNELLDHIKFDHGYTVSSPPIINLLEIIHKFDQEQRRAFLQFVTGAPRLPPGGFASLSPKLTIVRKQSSNCADLDLPSVMTCANYLKLPPYSSQVIFVSL
ncbi:hypothetical protein C1H46_004999 [Malus baccata]|uniref:HECT-type E3 ubiquitin transferase n=1 Tax=Malus baccata TaxID=106549 RepID=A0A540NEA3_MALBA|nr:hypothetical protein C1H46_004999 [Malus baccata]